MTIFEADLEYSEGILLRVYGEQMFDPRCRYCARFIKFPAGPVFVKDNTGAYLSVTAPCGLIKGTTDGSGNPWFVTHWMNIPER